MLASLAAFGLLCCIAVGAGLARSLASRAAALAALAALVALVAIGPQQRSEADPAPVVCEGRAPAVCAFSERRAWLPATRRTIVALQRELTMLAPGLPLPERYSEGGSTGPGVKALQVADPDDRAALSRDVADVLVLCSDEAILGYVALTIAREVFGPAHTPSPTEFGLLQPAPLLRASRVRREALREVRRTRASWC